MAISFIKGKGSIIHLSNVYNGLIKNDPQMGKFGNTISRIASVQAGKGLNVKVVVPKVRNIDLEGFTQVNENLLTKAINNVDVCVVGKEFSKPYPQGEHSIDEYEDFAKGFIEILKKGTFGKVSVVHAHDYGMGMVFPYIEGEDIIKVFTVYDPINFDHIFKLKPSHPGLYHDPFQGYAHNGGLSGLKAGIWTADITTMWDEGYLNQLTEKTTYKGFLKHIDNINPFYRMRTSWRPWDDSEIPESAIESFSRGYLQSLYGKGHKFSINLFREPLCPDKVLVSVTERIQEQDDRGAMVENSLKEASEEKSLNVEVVRRGQKVKAYGDNVGGLVQMFEAIFSKGDSGYNKKGTYYALLTGGVGERLMNICMAAGGIKGEVLLGRSTLNQIAIKQAKIIAQQLKDGGEGFVVMFGNDNVIIPNGPIVTGDHLLSAATQKLILFAQPEQVMNIPPEKNIDYLKGLGIMLADPKTGELLEFHEKLAKRDNTGDHFDIDFIKARLEKSEATSVYKNSFYMAMSLDVAELFYKLYSEKTHKDATKKFHEVYAIDWSSRFVEAAISTQQAWMDRYDTKEEIQKIYDRGDWEYLWKAAQEVKAKAGGIGVADIGQEAKWYDVGTIKELHRLYTLLVDNSNPEQRDLFREIMKLPLDKTIDNSYVAGVDIKNMENVLISNSVFEKGGSVGRNCVIIDSYFHEYTEIPSNTVVVGSNLYTIDNEQHKSQTKSKLIYCVHKNDRFWFNNEVAVASVFFHDGTVKAGEFPIELTGKERVLDAEGQPVKDSILKHYNLDGKIKAQPIKGIALSVSGVKYLYSATKAKQVYRDLLDQIQKFISQHGSENK